jgi:hypothetical protein
MMPHARERLRKADGFKVSQNPEKELGVEHQMQRRIEQAHPFQHVPPQKHRRLRKAYEMFEHFLPERARMAGSQKLTILRYGVRASANQARAGILLERIDNCPNRTREKIVIGIQIA